MPRVYQVLATGIGDTIINDSNLAMVPDVSTLEQHLQWIYMQCSSDFNAGFPETPGWFALQEVFTANCIQQDPELNATAMSIKNCLQQVICQTTGFPYIEFKKA